jgi:hypothetical protein
MGSMSVGTKEPGKPTPDAPPDAAAEIPDNAPPTEISTQNDVRNTTVSNNAKAACQPGDEQELVDSIADKKVLSSATNASEGDESTEHKLTPTAAMPLDSRRVSLGNSCHGERV